MWTEEKLDSLLTEPSENLIEDIKIISGDIMVLGAGGKMGPSLSLLAKKAMDAAGKSSKVIAVSRFSDPFAVKLLKENNVEAVSCELMDETELSKLPDVENIIYMAGRKFGTGGQEYLSWAMNTWLPARIADKYKNSKIVVFSSGNIYPQFSVDSGGAVGDAAGNAARGAAETTTPEPVGEYAMSTLGRERMFEYAAHAFNTPVAMFRLNYAVDLRYGVLFDIAQNILSDSPVSLGIPYFNCIWQGDANEVAIRCLVYSDKNVFKLNVTGPETVSVKDAAIKLGRLLGKEPVFTGKPGETALLSDASKMFSLFGHPSVTLDTLIKWQAEWLLDGGRGLGKPTHFEERKGQY